MSYPLALILLTVIAVPVGGEISTAAVLWGLLAGVGQAFGVWWFYAALGAGPISVVSPLTSVLVAGVPVGVGVALGERPSALALCGVGLALIAVVMGMLIPAALLFLMGRGQMRQMLSSTDQTAAG